MPNAGEPIDGRQPCSEALSLERDFGYLRAKWLAAVADSSEGLNPDPVFESLERKLKIGFGSPSRPGGTQRK